MQIAEIQLEGGRHFLEENPAGSNIFKDKRWNRLRIKYPFICDVNFPQCQTGLKHPVSRLPIQKNTTFRASCELLLKPFRHLKCNCPIHDIIQGSVPGRGSVSKIVQEWPQPLVGRVVQGIVALKARKSTYIVDEETFLISR